MPIDVDTPGSDGWWLQELSWKLQRRLPRIESLDRWFRGDSPLPEGNQVQALRLAYQALQRKARTNYAELIVEAVGDRMQVTGFRTAAGDDDNGDREARRIWQANRLDVHASDVHDSFLALGDAYVIVGAGDDGVPLITGEDPRQVVTDHDPRDGSVRAALKMFVDTMFGLEFAYLYLPGQVLVASREVRRAAYPAPRGWFSSQSWSWDDDRSSDLPFDRVPVVRFQNRSGLDGDCGIGEFEPHIDLLDRINHGVFQRMTIATMQAFRQRAIKNAPMVDEETGLEIDWEGILVADPGAVWAIPGSVELWESGQVDLTPILSAVRDDLQSLSAVTRTPFHMLSPEGANQSAEGASLSREGVVFKAEKRIARATESWKDVMSLAFLWAKDEERADRSQLEVLWQDPERRSLSELADAAVKKQAAGVPWRQNMVDLGYAPETIDRMESERASDLLNEILRSPAANAQPQPVPPVEQPEQFVNRGDSPS